MKEIRFSCRESEVLEFLVEGEKQLIISLDLGISERMVSKHIENIANKLELPKPKCIVPYLLDPFGERRSEIITGLRAANDPFYRPPAERSRKDRRAA